MLINGKNIFMFIFTYLPVNFVVVNLYDVVYCGITLITIEEIAEPVLLKSGKPLPFLKSCTRTVFTPALNIAGTPVPLNIGSSPVEMVLLGVPQVVLNLPKVLINPLPTLKPVMDKSPKLHPKNVAVARVTVTETVMMELV